ncbi:CDGSH iron-sulfur domain-containing protein [Elioraea rosea]|uniref:CDGSH iron-sulfur domain-containing protein n=1 Tax=Elioraea rosea TaxID=2492390 RepID=UPI0011849167|nr:CDGSH iron-sulfur domain-containing protein [Elioraea rosea]
MLRSAETGQGEGAPAPRSPVVAQAGPYPVEVKAGEKYFWCACGLSVTQPFCDGTHAGTGLKPVIFRAQKDETIWFCGCKATGDKPLCDGSHERVAGDAR